MKKTLMILVVIVGIGFAGWQIVQSQDVAGPVDDSQTIVAQYEWNGKQYQMSLAELRAAIEAEPQYRQRKYKSKEGKVTYLEEIINKKLKHFAAAEKGFDADEAFLKKAEDYKHQLMIERLTEIEVDEKISITEDDLKAYYDEHKGDYVEEAQIRATCITVADERLAQDTLAQVKGGRDIVEMAKELSEEGKLTGPGADPDDPGNAGFFSRGTSVRGRGFIDAVFDQEIGETTEEVFVLEVEDQTYYMIFRKEEYKPERQQPLDEVKSRIESRVKREKKQQRIVEWVEVVMKEGKIKTYPERLPTPPVEEDPEDEKSEEQ